MMYREYDLFRRLSVCYISRVLLAAGSLFLFAIGSAAGAGPVCRNSSGPGKNFVFACDEVCDPAKTDPCQGVYWKERDNDLRATRYERLLNRCITQLRQVSPQAAKVCGCPWYARPSQLCYLQHAWQVDCNTFCFHEEMNPSGTNCQGLIWTNSEGEWGGAEFVSGRCHGTSPGSLLRVVDRSWALEACHQCQQQTLHVSPRKTAAELAADSSRPMSAASAAALAALRERIRAWVPCVDLNTCPRDPATGAALCTQAHVKPCREITAPGALKVSLHGDSCRDGPCSISGDLTYESGPGCLAGEMDQCANIRAAQDREGLYGPRGAWYRNPEHARRTRGPDGVLFSRDQSLGILQYLLRTRDHEAAALWFGFLARNRKLVAGTLFNLCPERPGARPADDRCRVLPDILTIYYRVLQAIGFDMNRLDPGMRRQMETLAALNTDRLTLLVSASTVRVRGPNSYEGSLQAIAANILDRAGAGVFRDPLGRTRHTLEAAEILDRRSNRINPGWHFYALRRRPTERLAWMIQQLCTPEKPPYGSWFESYGVLNRSSGWVSAENLFFSGASTQYYPGVGPFGYVPRHNGHECVDLITAVLESVGR
jgi:hypothetical protein